VEDAQFAISVIGRDEIQRRHVADEERRRQERRRREIPEELRVVETECVRLRQAIPATAIEIEKTHKKIEVLERSIGEQRDLLHRSVVGVEALRREAQSLGLAIPENTALPPRTSLAPLPPAIPAPPKADPNARSRWLPESLKPTWQVTSPAQ
jgi:hypothetical protein